MYKNEGKSDSRSFGQASSTISSSSSNSNPTNVPEIKLNPAQRALKSMETSHRSQLVIRQKVAVIGDSAVGKTALIEMFHSGGQSFPKNYVMTIGCDFKVKMIQLDDKITNGLNVGVELYFFDTAGQSVFNQRQLAQKYWENVSTVIAVYDVGNRDSFVSLSKWLTELQAVAPHRPLSGIVIANKMDLRDVGRMAIGSDEGQQFAQQHGLTFFQTSALDSKGVDAPFQHVAVKAYEKYTNNLERVQKML
jgi:transport family protein 27